MSEKPALPYQQTVSCEPHQNKGIIFIKVVAMPYEEFDVAQARAFAERILAVVELVELGWDGKSGAPIITGGVWNSTQADGFAA